MITIAETEKMRREATTPSARLKQVPPVIDRIHLTVQLINGRREQFVQSEPEAIRQIREQWRPERFFAQTQIMLAEQEAVTVIPTARIERVELRADPLPEWSHYDNAADITEITEEAFRQMPRRTIPEPLIRPVTSPELSLRVEMRSGTTTWLRVRPNQRANWIAAGRPPMTAEDAHLFLSHLFTRQVVHGMTEDRQAIFLLNPAHVDQFMVASAPPRSIAGAWPMARVAAL